MSLMSFSKQLPRLPRIICLISAEAPNVHSKPHITCASVGPLQFLNISWIFMIFWYFVKVFMMFLGSNFDASPCFAMLLHASQDAQDMGSKCWHFLDPRCIFGLHGAWWICCPLPSALRSGLCQNITHRELGLVQEDAHHKPDGDKSSRYGGYWLKQQCISGLFLKWCHKP